MTSRFSKPAFRCVTVSNRFVMATFACECIQSGSHRHTRANCKHNSESACGSEGSDVSVARRSRGLHAFEGVPAWSAGGQIARLTTYDAVAPGGCCEPGKKIEDLRCMALHTLLLLLQAG